MIRRYTVMIFSVATKQSSNGQFTYVILTANRSAPTDYYNSMVDPTVTINMKPSKNSDNTTTTSDQPEKNPVTYTIQPTFKPATGQSHEYDVQNFKVLNVIEDNNDNKGAIPFGQSIFANKGALPFPNIFPSSNTPYADNGYSDVTKINDNCLTPGTNAKNIMYLYSQNAFVAFAQIALPKSTDSGNAVKQLQDPSNGYKTLTWTVQIDKSESGKAAFDVQEGAPLGVYRAPTGSSADTPDSAWTLDKAASSSTKLVYHLDISKLDPTKDQGTSFNVEMPIKTQDAKDWVNISSTLTGQPVSSTAKIPDLVKVPAEPYQAHMLFSNPNAVGFQPVLYQNENAIARTGDQLVSMGNQGSQGDTYFRYPLDSKTNPDGSVPNSSDPYPYPGETEPAVTGNGTALIRFGYHNDSSNKPIPNNDTFITDCYDFNNTDDPNNVNRKKTLPCTMVLMVCSRKS